MFKVIGDWESLVEQSSEKAMLVSISQDSAVDREMCPLVTSQDVICWTRHFAGHFVYSGEIDFVDLPSSLTNNE